MRQAPVETHKVDEVADIQYEDSAVNLLARRFLYQFARPEIGVMDTAHPEANWGIDGEIILALQRNGLDDIESIADVGCGDGGFIDRLDQAGYKGQITGINKSPALYGPMKNKLASKDNINFMPGDATNLMFEDGSRIPDDYYGAATFNFVAYHIEDYEKALKEIIRVVKPGGLVGIATRQVGNQRRVWEYAGSVTEDIENLVHAGKIALDQFINVRYSQKPAIFKENTTSLNLEFDRPEPFYSHYKVEDENRILTDLGMTKLTSFGQNKHDGRNSQLWIPGDAVYEYMFAVYSVSYVMQTQQSDDEIGCPEIYHSIKKIVQPDFEQETADGNFFKEDVSQSFQIWKK